MTARRAAGGGCRVCVLLKLIPGHLKNKIYIIKYIGFYVLIQLPFLRDIKNRFINEILQVMIGLQGIMW